MYIWCPGNSPGLRLDWKDGTNYRCKRFSWKSNPGTSNSNWMLLPLSYWSSWYWNLLAPIWVQYQYGISTLALRTNGHKDSAGYHPWKGKHSHAPDFISISQDFFLILTLINSQWFEAVSCTLSAITTTLKLSIVHFGLPYMYTTASGNGPFFASQEFNQYL